MGNQQPPPGQTEEESVAYGNAPKGKQEKPADKYRAISILMGTATFIALAYIWGQPLLYQVGFSNYGNAVYQLDNHTQQGKPDLLASYSLSEYISTPQATGGMATVMFLPIVFMWQAPGEQMQSICFITLLGFQICFGLFLAFTVIYMQLVHGIFVLLFCIFILIHMIVKVKAGYNNWKSTLVLVIAICGFIMIILAKVLQKWYPALQHHKRFYYYEMVGLSGLILYTPVYVLAEAHERSSNETHLSLTQKIFGTKTQNRGRKISSQLELQQEAKQLTQMMNNNAKPIQAKVQPAQNVPLKNDGNKDVENPKQPTINKRDSTVIGRARSVTQRELLEAKHGLTRSTTAKQVEAHKMSSNMKFLIIFGSLIPTVYIWMLPILSKKAYAGQQFNHNHNNKTHKLVKLSAFLSTPQATGGMVASFYFVFILLWDAPIFAKTYSSFFTSKDFCSLFGFQMSFFLSCTFNEIYAGETVHYIFYLVTLIFMLIFFYAQRTDGLTNKLSRTIHWVIVFGLALCILLAVIAKLKGVPFGKYFFYLESIVLTSIIWSTPVLLLDKRLMLKEYSSVTITNSWLDYNSVNSGQAKVQELTKLGLLKKPLLDGQQQPPQPQQPQQPSLGN